ncbi:MAG: hypothetical protein KA747_02270, partial [Ignavibacteriaceae bacterium]|nr:hypothetical protein [Ignavibacteriaceae bacterium]
MKTLIPVVLLLVALSGCGKDFKKSPVDNLISKLDSQKVPMYSIILEDMEVDGTVFQDYKHKYQ